MTQQQDARRTIVPGQSTIKPIIVDTTASLQSWLTAQASEHTLRWLLLHAETGVVWGEWQSNTLVLSSSAAALNWNMLHQARLFGENGELFVWQGPQAPQARLIEDGEGEATAWLDERQVLSGNRADLSWSASPDFTPITEGSQGISHAPPIGNKLPVYRQPNEKQSVTDRARLIVRHYIGEDNAGVARISSSRLVKLLKPGEE